MGDIQDIFDEFLSMFSDIFSLYTGTWLMASVLGLWILGRVVNILRRILP